MAKSIEQFRKDVRILRTELHKVAVPTIKGFTAEIRKKARRDYLSRGIGRALWASGAIARKRNPPLILRTIRARLSASGGAWVGGVKIAGIAAYIEQGLRLAPHRIRGDPLLYFRVDNRLVVARSVQHPGASVAHIPSAQQGIREVIPQVERILTANLNKLWAEVAS